MQRTPTSSRKLGGKTPEERRADRWHALMAAAVKVYGERGYRNSTIKAVCDAAGLTERYFYESFSSSEDLLCACFQERADELIADVRRAALQASGAPLDRVKAGVLIYLEKLRSNPPSTRVFLIEMSNVSARADALVSENLDRFGALLVHLLSTSGSIYAEPPPLLLRGVIGGGLHVAQAWISSGYAEEVDRVAETILQLYGLVAADLGAAQPPTQAPTPSPRRKRVAKPS